MKAIVYDRYGPPERLALANIPKPVPKDNEVLVRVRASSINEWDWSLLHGRPLINRLMFGLFRPKRRILGDDIAGVVEAVGRSVTKFKVGDEVFADMWDAFGGFAEYTCALETSLVRLPTNLSFSEAAAVPQAGILALFGLQNTGQIKPGHRVLIVGAGGGVGTIAVQLAKHFGASQVTCVDRGEKLALLRDIGADQTINHMRADVCKCGQTYDLILDIVGKRPVIDFYRLLSPGGIYVMVGGSTLRFLEVMFLGLWCRLARTGKKVRLLAQRSEKTLPQLKDLIEQGIISPVVDRCFPLEEVPAAYRYYGQGHFTGKIVITIDDGTT